MTSAFHSIRQIARDIPFARATMLRLYLLSKKKAQRPGGVLFLFYHDIKSDEQELFHQHLRTLLTFGQIVGIGEALKLIDDGDAHENRICLTFDDGYRGAFDHGVPILVQNGLPAAFFVVPQWIDERRRGIISWDDCRQLKALGMEVGSHCLTHTRLTSLNTASAAVEFILSRERIEAELGSPCVDCACPWGQPKADYHIDREPKLAREAGYRSFFTTVARRARPGTDLWAIPRVRMEPSWGAWEIKYALSRP